METKTFLEPSLERQLKGHKNSITALHYSPNEQQIASSSLDNSVLLWDLRGSMRSYRFLGHDEAVTDVTFSPTGKYMASASRDKTVRLWVPTVTGSTGVFKAHSQTVRSVQFSSDSTKILTASDDKIVKLWSSEKHKFIASFVGHTNWVRCARISTDCSVIASCSDDKTTRLWNPNSGQSIHTYKDQKGHGLCLAWHPTGCYVAVGTSQGNVKLYDIRTHELVQYYSIHSDVVTKIAFHPSGSYIVTSSKDGKMKILDLLEGHPIFTINGHSGAVNTVGFSPSGDTFASAGDDRLLFIWKTNFTELQNDENENVSQNPASLPGQVNSGSQKSQSNKKSSSKGVKPWSKCYHSYGYPVTTFAHIDICNTSSPNPSTRVPSMYEEPLANSTMLDSSMPQRSNNLECQNNSCSRIPQVPNEANSCLRNSINSDTNSHRNLNASNGTHNTNLSPKNPIVGDECNANFRSRKSTECDTNSRSRITAIASNKCHNTSCLRNSIVTTDWHVNYCPGNSENVSNVSNTNISQQNHNITIESHANSCPRSSTKHCTLNDDPSYNVGHISHIPRTPPSPTTYTIPSLGQNISSTCRMCGIVGNTRNMSSNTTQNPNLSMSIATGGATFCKDESLFGMISLKENDVCYTSGTIEWVGRKRSYPLNTGFKVLSDGSKHSHANEAKAKKKQKLDETFKVGMDSMRECDCTDMLPTVNAIVDHLNALHEAVDLVDLRLSNLEETH